MHMAEATGTHRILTDDGVTLRAISYGARETAKAVVLINSATGVFQEFYAPFATFLAAQGYFVVSYDYRGVGNYKPVELRKIEATMTDWGAKDFPAVVAYLARIAPRLEIICIGHSVGGQLLGLLPDNNRIAGLLAVGAQVGYWRFWSGKERWQSWFMFFVAIPVLTAIFGYFPGSWMGTCNLPAGVAKEWARWCRSRDFIADAKGLPLRAGFAAYRGQALFVSFYDDALFAPKPAVDELSSYYSQATKERVHIEARDVRGRAVGHFGFFRTTSKKILWMRALAWIERTTGNQRSRKWKTIGKAR